MKMIRCIYQGWGAGVGAGCFWLLGAGAAWKKSGAGVAKKLAGPQPCWKINSIRKLYFFSFFSSLGKILSLYG